ncbi:AAA-domain-containing protein [Hyaloscypha bicolor E]|uniref:AAA-domain-containing protein n=1 Tax=Hyaloscypha bicolor E TaxID=1095630 RepID=A0A2J6SXG1_9HELO|nr:AAA-domain-containing protein [Hyaloscypha bicolor E]PMD55431.1 AAA-domain-containing protein [Hyaloscypha bicolor E]
MQLFIALKTGTDPEPLDDEVAQENQKEDKYSRESLDKQLNESLDKTVLTNKPNVAWDDVAGLAEAKMELQIAAEMPKKFPQLFRGKREPQRFILLYGPPGTGKGQLIKALASGVNSTLFTISSSDVQSKWVGESERLVRLVFERARKEKPSMIFIDEIEALCGIRDSNSSSEHDNRVKTEFLVQMDGVSQDNNGILFIAATNLPWILDPAIIRRFRKRIYIPLPDEEARKRLFEIHVGETCCDVSTEDYAEFARRTEGFSGSDISNVVQEALMEPMKKIFKAEYFCYVLSHGKRGLAPCQLGQQGAAALNWRDIPSYQLLEPAVAKEDFYNALAKAKPTVNKELLQDHCRWTEKYGKDGA